VILADELDHLRSVEHRVVTDLASNIQNGAPLELSVVRYTCSDCTRADYLDRGTGARLSLGFASAPAQPVNTRAHGLSNVPAKPPSLPGLRVLLN